MCHTYVTLIQTVYRALLASAVSGIGHRIHTPKKMANGLLPTECVFSNNLEAEHMECLVKFK